MKVPFDEAGCLASWLRACVSIGLVVLTGCASLRIDVRRPEIALQGYVLASAPSSDASQFLGRRYDGSSGEMGDKPCTFSPIGEAESNQRIVADLSRADLASLNLSQYRLFAAGVDTHKLEALRVELRTTRRAAITLHGCREPVIFDAVAGNLYIEYHFDDKVVLKAGSDALRPFGTGIGGRYHVDERRNVVSETLKSDQYVAFRVHEPSSRKSWGIALLAVGGAVIVGGLIADLIMMHDGKDSPAEVIPVVMYVAGGGSTVGGTILVW